MTTPESVIEIGSTGVRLLVAETRPDNKQNILDRSELPVHLGRDVFTSGIISQDTQNQLVQIFLRYKEQLISWGLTPEDTYCFATTAFRDAKNCDPVMDRILVQTGFRIHIADGIEENKLTYLGVSSCIQDQNVAFKNEDTVILVVGGSTTEIMLMNDGKMAGVHSLRFGTIRIEQHMKSLASSYDNIRRFVEESINSTKGSLDSELNISNVKQFIAVGPDVTLAALQCGQPISTFLWKIEKEKFQLFVQDLQHYTVNEIVARFKISYTEAETLQVSLLIYNLFLQLTKANTIIVPETDVLQGYLLSKTSTQNEFLMSEFTDQVVASAKNLLRKYHGDEAHAECVRMISCRIYDVMKSEVALDNQARLLLETAAILHDIGVFIRNDNHNLHSWYIIKNSEIFGLNRKDNTIVAEIAKYHKGALSPQDDENFLMMPRSDRMTILKLTAILRIADALDRGHIQQFSDFSIRLTSTSLELHTKKSHNPVLERLALSEKSEMFESTFGYKVILI